MNWTRVMLVSVAMLVIGAADVSAKPMSEGQKNRLCAEALLAGQIAIWDGSSWYDCTGETIVVDGDEPKCAANPWDCVPGGGGGDWGGDWDWDGGGGGGTSTPPKPPGPCDEDPMSKECRCELNPGLDECICNEGKPEANVDYGVCSEEACGSKDAACDCCKETASKGVAAIQNMVIASCKFQMRAISEGMCFSGTEPPNPSCRCTTSTDWIKGCEAGGAPCGPVDTETKNCNKCVDCYMNGSHGTTVRVDTSLSSKLTSIFGEVGVTTSWGAEASYPAFSGYNSACTSLVIGKMGDLAADVYNCLSSNSCFTTLPGGAISF